MAIDTTVAELLTKGMRGLNGRLTLLERNHFPDHIYAKRALVIAGDLAQTACLNPTEDNVRMAKTALQYAVEVFNAVDVLVGTGSRAGIQRPLEQLEMDYVRDFPKSNLASKIREGPHYVSL